MFYLKTGTSGIRNYDYLEIGTSGIQNYNLTSGIRNYEYPQNRNQWHSKLWLPSKQDPVANETMITLETGTHGIRNHDYLLNRNSWHTKPWLPRNRNQWHTKLWLNPWHTKLWLHSKQEPVEYEIMIKPVAYETMITFETGARGKQNHDYAPNRNPWRSKLWLTSKQEPVFWYIWTFCTVKWMLLNSNVSKYDDLQKDKRTGQKAKFLFVVSQFTLLSPYLCLFFQQRVMLLEQCIIKFLYLLFHSFEMS